MTPGNLAAADVDLTDDEFAQIEGELAKEQLKNTGVVRGHTLQQDPMSVVARETNRGSRTRRRQAHVRVGLMTSALLQGAERFLSSSWVHLRPSTPIQTHSIRSWCSRPLAVRRFCRRGDPWQEPSRGSAGMASLRRRGRFRGKRTH